MSDELIKNQLRQSPVVATDANIKDLVRVYIEENENDFRKIGNWDVSQVTMMSELFAVYNNFNEDISGWDVSNVENMFRMFSFSKFNQDISKWDITKVTNMSYMFQQAIEFNSPLNWEEKTFRVKNMSRMFVGATSFNQPLSWNTENVTNMESMFYGATSFNQPLIWNTTNVKNMSGMFYGATSFNQPLSWNTTNVTNMDYMFYGATLFNQDLSRWDVSNVMVDRRTEFSTLKDEYTPRFKISLKEEYEHKMPTYLKKKRFSIQLLMTMWE